MGQRPHAGPPCHLSRRHRCLDPKTVACEQHERRIPCDEESLLFGYEDRESPLYFQIRNVGKSRGEGLQWFGRRRYNDTSKTAETRPYRLGIAHVELRAALADFLDIFRVCLRHGWIGNWPRLNADQLVRRSGGEKAVISLQRKRAKLGLLLPRGERAIEDGWAWDGTIRVEAAGIEPAYAAHPNLPFLRPVNSPPPSSGTPDPRTVT